MTRSVKFLMVVAVVASLSGALYAQTNAPKVKAIRFGKLIDGTGKVLTNAVVIVKGDRIDTVGATGTSIPANAQLIDMSAFTGLPGLIDVHTHMTYWRDKTWTLNANEEAEKLLPQEAVFLAQENARNCINIGVTTVRDLA